MGTNYIDYKPTLVNAQSPLTAGTNMFVSDAPHITWLLWERSFYVQCSLVPAHGFLYYTRTDFMPLADSQKKAKIYSYSCIQFTAHWAQYIYNCFLLDIYNTFK